MDISVLPLAEVDLKVEDVAIKFEDDDGSKQYEGEFCSANGPQPDFVVESDSYEKINFHSLTDSPTQGKSYASLRRFQCTHCFRMFSRSDHLKNHMRTHTGERPYECDVCQRSFAKHFDLTRHKQYVHGSVTIFFICEECGRTFSRKDHLKSHLITHKNLPMKLSGNGVASPLKTFTCKTCGRTYCRLENLKKHVEKHSRNLNQGCIPKGVINDLKDETITEKIFKGINFHFMNVNDVKTPAETALRSFACEFCNRLFLRKEHLKNHERTHTGEKPFQCDQCDKKFAKRFVMTRHQRNVHQVNTKMHKCPECDRMFARTDHLKTHMKIHILAMVRNQQEKTYRCHVCDQGFSRSEDLNTHMTIHFLAAVKQEQQQDEEDVLGNAEAEEYDDAEEKECQNVGEYLFGENCEKNMDELERHLKS